MFRSIGFIASKMSNILAALSIVKQLTYLVSFLLACRACQTLVGGAELVVQLDVSVQASPKKKKKKIIYYFNKMSTEKISENHHQNAFFYCHMTQDRYNEGQSLFCHFMRLSF